MDEDEMSNHLTAEDRHTQNVRRREWLLMHPGLLKDLPSGAATMTVAEANVLDRVYKLMVDGGLYSRSSDRYAGRWAVRRLVSQIRGLPVLKQHRYELRHL
jgi:hypothetical protein